MKADQRNVLFVIVLLLIAIALSSISQFSSIVGSTKFGGLNFDIIFEDVPTSTGAFLGKDGNCYWNNDDNVLTLGISTSNTGGANCVAQSQEDISDIEEFLLFFYGAYKVTGDPNNMQGGSNLNVVLTDGTTTINLWSKGTGISNNPNPNFFSGEGVVEPLLLKFVNDGQGTITVWQGLGSINDNFFIKVNDFDVSLLSEQKLQFGVAASFNGADGAFGTAEMTALNIVFKEDNQPLCLADETIVDGGCEKIATLLLEQQTAFQDRFDELEDRLALLELNEEEENCNLWCRFVNFIKGLFGNNEP